MPQDASNGSSDSGGYSVEQCLRVLSSKVSTPKGRAALATLRAELGNSDRASRASERFKKGRNRTSGGDMPSKGNVRQAFGGQS